MVAFIKTGFATDYICLASQRNMMSSHEDSKL